MRPSEPLERFARQEGSAVVVDRRRAPHLDPVAGLGHLPVHRHGGVDGDVAGLDARPSRHDPERVALPGRVDGDHVGSTVVTDRCEVRERRQRGCRRLDIIERDHRRTLRDAVYRCRDDEKNLTGRSASGLSTYRWYSKQQVRRDEWPTP